MSNFGERVHVLETFIFKGYRGVASLSIFARDHNACDICYIFFTLFDEIQGGSDEWVCGVKSHIFGICQKVFLGIKMKMVQG